LTRCWIEFGSGTIWAMRAIQSVAMQRVRSRSGRYPDVVFPTASAKPGGAGVEPRCRVLEGSHVHDRRHTWASRMKMAGIDDRTLMDLGGWTDIAMVRRYAHVSPEYKLKTDQLVNGTACVAATQVVGLIVGQPSPCGKIAPAE
jgi:integrase